MSLSKLPAIQFYPGDWKKDIGVQSLSFHDRGVWFEMLMLMHDSADRGKLVLNGRPMPDEVVARAIGLDNQTFNQTLTNLLTFGVASRDEETGALMSRRMVKDENLRKARIEAGKMGGNPVLLKQISTTGDKQSPTPSSSSSATEQISGAKAPSPRETSGKAVEAIYQAYPRKVGKEAALKAIDRAVKRIQTQESLPLREAQVKLYGAVQAYARSPAGNRGDLTPHPATWFNEGRYSDDAKEWGRDGTRESSSGSGESRGSAGRVERGIAAVGRIAEQFGWTETGGIDGADGEPLSAPGDRRGDADELYPRPSATGEDSQFGESEAGDDEHSHAAKPEILSPPHGSRGGAGSHGQ